ncbi:MAG: 23S rRNA (pseudouridine(1915)-N(3))-methyltransferase RlmH [Tannerella sp.]|jgi:23S rRNA (pseudouridine1915-N3)-methyltransferase|nr:23S rRNA (pseudouridine(1915)-N(3))-methyltransferase RlmH [Tannerella sp.]
MKIVLLVVGKTDAGPWDDAFKTYSDRLAHYVQFETEVIPDVKKGKNLSVAQQKEREGESIISAMQAGDCCILLDERGKSFTSAGFAAYIAKKMTSAPRRIVFVIGGPYGFSRAVYDAVPERISLSEMTFSHQMIRPIFAEQLYRAMTILRNEPYHHE